MSVGDRVFERFSPFIQDYIYQNKWTELRDIQVAAGDILFHTDNNLLLSSGTASGKTEAAFLPTLTLLQENPSDSVGILYISPLKALINDQFYRLDGLLTQEGIKVTRWHGDVSQTIKAKLLKEPQGVLQTTPESLEAMLMRNRSAVIQLFHDLRYVVIDEVHYFMSNDRGIQLLCILERIQKLTGVIPIRIGLSATLTDYSSAKRWLNAGTNRECSAPTFAGHKRSLQLSLQYFPIQPKEHKKEYARTKLAYYEYLYEVTFNRRCILFANAKAQVEQIIANLKQIAQKNHAPDIYYVHHGSISASLRELTERKMKQSEDPIVTGATVTLELGIDIGNLERIVQTGSPFTVSSFVQRLGRTGRRGNAAQMWFVFEEEERSFDYEFYKAIPWDMIKCMALIQLYLEEKWIEPLPTNQLPYGLLYHQTMSFLLSAGEISPALLAQNILSLHAFSQVPQSDYQILLRHLLQTQQLERSERGGILIGLEGEKQVNHFEFFAVFDAQMEYAVKNESEEIGTVQQVYPIGERFALAGRTWEVLDINKKARELFVKQIPGLSSNTWVTPLEVPLHTKVLQKMNEILAGNQDYAYLSEDARARLAEIRQVAQKANICKDLVVPLAEGVYGIFPWMGTSAMLALLYALKERGFSCELYKGYELPLFIMVHSVLPRMQLLEILKELQREQLDKFSFSVANEAQIAGKFNDFLPKELLRKQYIADFIDVEEMQENVMWVLQK